MEKVLYYIREGLKNIVSNVLMTIASVGVLTVCLLLIGSSWLVALNVEKVIQEVSNKNQIMVYLKMDIDQAGIDTIGQKIRAIPSVASVAFVSKDEAMEELKEQFGDQDELISGLNNDFLPCSYKVMVNSMDNYSSTVAQLETIEGIDNVKSNSTVADKLISINNVVNIVGVALFILLGLVALFLISNTIKIAVYVRRREVNIMKFVGATDWFIRGPFMVEGMIIGIISGIIAFVAELYIYNLLIAYLFSVLNITAKSFIDEAPVLIVAFLLFGMLVGVLGSVVSLRKYLKV